MVSLWPWRHRDDSSTASFEKTLSTLSSKITDIQARLDALRARSRRARVLWTLYLSFAYLVYAIVIILVVGSRNMGPYEWTAVAGGPVLIYTTRATVAAYYNYRIESLSSQLKEQQTERAKTIKKLKEATKYDSTHELLEKYGGAEGRPSRPRKDSVADHDEEDDAFDRRPHHGVDGQFGVGAPRRTNLPPPPTANIQRQPYSPAPDPPQPGPDALSPHSPMSPNPQSTISSTSIPVTEEFAPNAFAHTPPPPPPPQAHARYDAATEPHWYDRVMDLLLGEDEMAAKNRIVLICQTCRLVNGQAPPGTNSLSELGPWKCMSCGSKNGEMDEGEKIVQEVLGARRKDGQQSAREPPAGTTDGEFEKEEGGYQDEVEPGVVDGRSERENGKATGGAKRRKGKK